MTDTTKNILHDDDITEEDGNLIFNPYNPLNKEITLSEVQSILKKYGVPDSVYNINLYKRAFVHKSYTKRPHLENVSENIEIEPQPDDCLALKQNLMNVLNFSVMVFLNAPKYYLYRRFPKENEGFMTEKKIALVKNETIGRLALEMGLHKWYVYLNT